MHSISYYISSYITKLYHCNILVKMYIPFLLSCHMSSALHHYAIPKSRLPHCIFATSTRLTVRSCHLPSMECMSSRVKNCLLAGRLIGQCILAFSLELFFVISLRYLRNHSMSTNLSWRCVWFWWATASTAKPLVFNTHRTPGRPHQIALWRGQQHQSLRVPGGQQGLQRCDDRSGWSTPYSWNGHPTLNDGNSFFGRIVFRHSALLGWWVDQNSIKKSVANHADTLLLSSFQICLTPLLQLRQLVTKCLHLQKICYCQVAIETSFFLP